MTHRERIFIGGCGAILPILASVYFLDLSKGMPTDMDLLRSIAAILAKSVILFFVGGFFAWLYKTEEDPVKLVQLGMSIPALLTALAAGADGSSQVTKLRQDLELGRRNAAPSAAAPNPSLPSPGKMAGSRWLFTLPVVHAQKKTGAPSQAPSRPGFPRATESFADWVLQSVLGVKSDRNYFVITCSHRSIQAAKREADELKKTAPPGWGVEVVAPSEHNLYYSIVIGKNLTIEEATKRAQDAIQAGFPPTTYVWTFGLPQKPPLPSCGPVQQFNLKQRRYQKLTVDSNRTIYVYVTDISKKLESFRIYVLFPSDGWSLNAKEVSEPDFVRQTQSASKHVLTFTQEGAQEFQREGQTFRVVVKKINYQSVGNDNVDLELCVLE